MENKVEVTFGKWLRAWRNDRGYSIKGAASLAGWNQAFWSNLEYEKRIRKNGLPPRPDEETVETVAKVLKIPIKAALLAAGHAPFEWQAQVCQMLPPVRENGYNAPSVFPDVTIVIQSASESTLEVASEKEVGEANTEERLEQLEGMVKHLMDLLEDGKEITNLPKAA